MCGVVTELIAVYEGFGYREEKGGGWSRVVGYASAPGGSGARSPIWGISASRALWSLYSVGIAVVISDGGCCVFVGVRSSQWSMGVSVGEYVGVWGSPRWWSCVRVTKSARFLWKESWCGDGVA